MKGVNGKPPQRFVTPTDLAKLLRVSPEKVRRWIRRGELKAVDLGIGSSRSCYRVKQEWLDEFLEARSVQPPAPRVRRRREEKPPEGGPIDPELGKQLEKKGQAVLVGRKYYRVWKGIIQFIK